MQGRPNSNKRCRHKGAIKHVFSRIGDHEALIYLLDFPSSTIHWRNVGPIYSQYIFIG